MSYVIIAECVDVKDGACTKVCPVDCIYEGGRMFYIHPDECVNCGLCESICPVDAIRKITDTIEIEKPFIKANKEFFDEVVTGWGSPLGWNAQFTSQKDHPLIDAMPDQTPNVENKNDGS